MIIRLFSKINKVLLNISDLPELIVAKYFNQTKLLSYKSAFDAVMLLFPILIYLHTVSIT